MLRTSIARGDNLNVARTDCLPLKSADDGNGMFNSSNGPPLSLFAISACLFLDSDRQRPISLRITLHILNHMAISLNTLFCITYFEQKVNA
jgi:hypothetical protein